MPIEGKTEGGQSAPLAELCKAINDHVAIIGNGGTGKTTFLHYLIEQSFAQSPEKFSDLPVYILLNLTGVLQISCIGTTILHGKQNLLRDTLVHFLKSCFSRYG